MRSRVRRRLPAVRRRATGVLPFAEGDVLGAVALIAAGMATSVTISNVDAERLAVFASTIAASAGVMVRLRDGAGSRTTLEFQAAPRG